MSRRETVSKQSQLASLAVTPGKVGVRIRPTATWSSSAPSWVSCLIIKTRRVICWKRTFYLHYHRSFLSAVSWGGGAVCGSTDSLLDWPTLRPVPRRRGDLITKSTTSRCLHVWSFRNFSNMEHWGFLFLFYHLYVWLKTHGWINW